MNKNQDQINCFVEKNIHRFITLVCYISLPLIFLFILTIGVSLISTGGINTDVNKVNDFETVFISFSLPMFITLAIVPLAIKINIQKRTALQLGLSFPKKPFTLVFCVATSIGSVLVAKIISRADNLELSAWTILVHFLFVAIAEEIMLRCIVMDELKHFTNNPWILCLLNGIIFAFIYHSNDDFLPNLLIRVPLGFVLSITRLKCKSVYPAIGLHWFYNMFITAI